MQLGIVGGVERDARKLQAEAEQQGHQVLFHSGHMHGRGRSTLEHLVERCELVLILTDTNAHGAVIHARQVARHCGRPCVLLRRLGPSRLRSLLAATKGHSPGESAEYLLAALGQAA